MVLKVEGTAREQQEAEGTQLREAATATPRATELAKQADAILVQTSLACQRLPLSLPCLCYRWGLSHGYTCCHAG